MKQLYLNIRYKLPDDFDGDLNDAIEHLLKYRRNDRDHKHDFEHDPNKSIDDNWWEMVNNTDRVLYGGVGIFTLNEEENKWEIDPINDDVICKEENNN